MTARIFGRMASQSSAPDLGGPSPNLTRRFADFERQAGVNQ
jgi:hypothetical protein